MDRLGLLPPQCLRVHLDAPAPVLHQHSEAFISDDRSVGAYFEYETPDIAVYINFFANLVVEGGGGVEYLQNASPSPPWAWQLRGPSLAGPQGWALSAHSIRSGIHQ